MPTEFIEKMAKYIAFLQHQYDVYRGESGKEDMAEFYSTKLSAARDICILFKCAPEIYSEVRRIYGGNR